MLFYKTGMDVLFLAHFHGSMFTAPSMLDASWYLPCLFYLEACSAFAAHNNFSTWYSQIYSERIQDEAVMGLKVHKYCTSQAHE